MFEYDVTGYCVKERKKVRIFEPKSVTMKNGRKAIGGYCPDCGCRVFKIGDLDNYRRNSMPKLSGNIKYIENAANQFELNLNDSIHSPSRTFTTDIESITNLRDLLNEAIDYYSNKDKVKTWSL